MLRYFKHISLWVRDCNDFLAAKKIITIQLLSNWKEQSSKHLFILQFWDSASQLLKTLQYTKIQIGMSVNKGGNGNAEKIYKNNKSF
jgi:hypothetical protein